MGRYDSLLNNRNQEEANKSVKLGVITDPRPDLTEDSALWVTFLTLARAESRQLYGNLHGFRCAGTRLVKATSGQLAGMYVMRPDVDPSGGGWDSVEMYEEFKIKYLKPMEPQLLKALADLNREFGVNRKEAG